MSRDRFKGGNRVRSMFWTIMLTQEHVLFAKITATVD